MSKFITTLYPNRQHFLSNGKVAAFEAGEVTVPDAFDDEMEAAGFEKVAAPKKPAKKEKAVEAAPAEEPAPTEE